MNQIHENKGFTEEQGIAAFLGEYCCKYCKTPVTSNNLCMCGHKECIGCSGCCYLRLTAKEKESNGKN